MQVLDTMPAVARRAGTGAMTDRVREILSCYESDSPGTKTNLARLLTHGYLAGTGKLVILPVDQGFEHGPARSFAVNPPGYDPNYHFEMAIEAGCNAYAAPNWAKKPRPRLTSSPMRPTSRRNWAPTSSR